MNRKPVKKTLTQEKKWTEQALDLQLSWTYNSRKPVKKMPTQRSGQGEYCCNCKPSAYPVYFFPCVWVFFAGFLFIYKLYYMVCCYQDPTH